MQNLGRRLAGWALVQVLGAAGAFAGGDDFMGPRGGPPGGAHALRAAHLGKVLADARRLSPDLARRLLDPAVEHRETPAGEPRRAGAGRGPYDDALLQVDRPRAGVELPARGRAAAGGERDRDADPGGRRDGGLAQPCRGSPPLAA